MNHDRFQQLRDQALDSLVKGSSTPAEYQDVLQKIDAAAVEAARLARGRLRAEPVVGPDGDVPTFIRPLESPQPAKGMLIGKYRLESDKGLRGGMSEVWKGVDTKNNRLVALKLLSPLLIGNEDEMARIQATFHLVEKLDHPHICRVFDLDEDERCGWYSVMRWVDGQTFSKYRREQVGPDGSLPLDDVVRLMQPVAEALDYAHGKKVLHRDIKPSNLMLDADGHVSVIDFGLAAEVRGSMSRVSQKAAEITGTRPYIAPEMWDGEPASRQTDQYALAVTAYELLAGRWPFHHDDIGIFARIVLTKPVPAIDGLPAPANAALAKALAKAAKERFSSCREFMSELRAQKAATVAEASRFSPNARRAAHEQTTAAPAEPDPAEQVVQAHARVQQVLTQAQAAFAQHDYAQTATLLDLLKEFPEHVGDTALHRKAITKRDRVIELDRLIREATPAMKLEVLRPAVDELLQLQPSRQDMQRLKEQINRLTPAPPVRASLPPVLPMRPPHNMEPPPLPVRASSVIQQGSKAGERTTFTLNGVEYAFRWCPPGKFTMGSPKSEAGRSDDEDQVSVELTSGFWMQETAVTQAMWQAVMLTQPWQRKSCVRGGPKVAATYVDWPVATKFAVKLTVAAEQAGVLPSGAKIMLPTEARWEYGCRAGTTTAYSFGNDAGKLGEYAWFNGNAWSKEENYAHEVGQKQANSWGLLDMHGNVCEWCQDYYDKKLPGGHNPCVTVGSSRVLRGGSWYLAPISARCSCRGCDDPAYRSNRIGFRVVVEL